MFCNTPGNGAADERAAIDKHVKADDWSIESSKVREGEQDKEPNRSEETCSESCCYTNWKPMRPC